MELVDSPFVSFRRYSCRHVATKKVATLEGLKALMLYFYWISWLVSRSLVAHAIKIWPLCNARRQKLAHAIQLRGVPESMRLVCGQNFEVAEFDSVSSGILTSSALLVVSPRRSCHQKLGCILGRSRYPLVVQASNSSCSRPLSMRL